MNRAPLVMYTVALVAGVAGAVAFARPARSEAAIYARRIVGTMLLALALILTIFAHAMARWEAAP